MMNYYYNVEITYINDTEELVSDVTSCRVHEGVLHLYHEEGSFGYRQQRHLGSFPLSAIKKWVRVARL